MNTNNETYLTFEEVEQILKISHSMLYKLINQKENPLPVVYLSERTPRVIKSQLDEWARQNFGKPENEEVPNE